MQNDIRWKQRFQNFDRAFLLLRSVFEEKDRGEFSQLEQEGIILRFEYTYELAWKTMKDYLLDNGIVILNEITPRNVNCALIWPLL
ncbi:MAG TPA: nucleotidyltransferase substrate binding protein [Ruminiclostridium sp.]